MWVWLRAIHRVIKKTEDIPLISRASFLKLQTVFFCGVRLVFFKILVVWQYLISSVAAFEMRFSGNVTVLVRLSVIKTFPMPSLTSSAFEFPTLFEWNGFRDNDLFRRCFHSPIKVKQTLLWFSRFSDWLLLSPSRMYCCKLVCCAQVYLRAVAGHGTVATVLGSWTPLQSFGALHWYVRDAHKIYWSCYKFRKPK